MRELLSRIWKKDEGFSLIELIIVIAILAIIAAIAVPNLLGNIQKASESKDESNAKLIADAAITFIAQNPEYEGVDVVGASATVGLQVDAAIGDTAPSSADEEDIIIGLISKLTGDAPSIESNKYEGAGTDFYIQIDGTTGEVTVTNDADLEIFPNPAP